MDNSTSKRPLFLLIIVVISILLVLAVLILRFNPANTAITLPKNLSLSNKVSPSPQSTTPLSAYDFSGTVKDISNRSLTVETLMGEANKTPQEAPPKLTDVTVTFSDQNLIQGIKDGQRVLIYADLSKSQVPSNKFFAINIRSLTSVAPLSPVNTSIPLGSGSASQP